MGSKELLPGLLQRNLPAQLAVLDSADVAFSGHGPEGECEIGVERKTLNDLVGSLRSGRLQGLSTEEQQSQLDRLHSTYDYVFLLVEGTYATDRRGRLVTVGPVARPVPGGYTEDSLEKALLSLGLRGGCYIKQTANAAQSVRWLASLYRSFTDKTWGEHTTMRTLMRPEKATGPMPVSAFRLAVMDLCPGIGLAASRAVEDLCRGKLSVMLALGLEAWESLQVPMPGGTSKRLGLAKAQRVLAALDRVR